MRMARRWTAAAVGLAGVLVLAACSGDTTATPTPTPRPTATPTLAPSPTPTLDLSPTPVPTPIPGASTVEIEAVADATLYDRGVLPAANGAGEALFFGSTNGNEARRLLVRFDVAGALPPGSTVASARLVMIVNRARGEADPSTLYRVTSSWDEGPTDSETAGEGSGTAPDPGSATWVHRSFPDVEWANPGGDFEATPHGSSLVVPPPRAQTIETSWGSTPEMVGDVQSWLDDPATNFGWIVIGNERTRQTTKRVGSRENPDPSQRPKLVLEYFPATGTRTVSLNPSMDATIYDDPAIANGMGEWIFAGVTRMGKVRRALLAFDIASKIPAGATVDGVSFALRVSQTSSGEQPVTLHAVLTPWRAGATDPDANEGKGGPAQTGDVTWELTGVGSASWTGAGGDFAPTAVAESRVGGIGSTVTFGPDEALNALVQRWLDDPLSNLGLMLVGNEAESKTAKRFDSLENFSGFPEPHPPVLTITYTN